MWLLDTSVLGSRTTLINFLKLNALNVKGLTVDRISQIWQRSLAKRHVGPFHILIIILDSYGKSMAVLNPIVIQNTGTVFLSYSILTHTLSGWDIANADGWSMWRPFSFNLPFSDLNFHLKSFIQFFKILVQILIWCTRNIFFKFWFQNR